jgi:hypothetical protein
MEKFTCTIESGDRGRVFITMPFDPAALWGKKGRHYVTGTINGHPFQGSLGSRGGSYFMPLNKELQSAAGVAPGDKVKVTIEADAPQEDGLPDDVDAALAASAMARTFFDGLSAFYRNSYLKWIESAKKTETRTARVGEMIGLLEEGKKQR